METIQGQYGLSRSRHSHRRTRPSLAKHSGRLKAQTTRSSGASSLSENQDAKYLTLFDLMARFSSLSNADKAKMQKLLRSLINDFKNQKLYDSKVLTVESTDITKRSGDSFAGWNDQCLGRKYHFQHQSIPNALIEITDTTEINLYAGIRVDSGWRTVATIRER